MAGEICSPFKNPLSPENSAGATVPPSRRVASQEPIIRFCKNTRVSLGTTSTEAPYLGDRLVLVWSPSGPSRSRLLAPKVTHGWLGTGEPPHHRYSGKTSAGDDCVAAVPAKPESRSEDSKAQGTHPAELLPSNLRGPSPKGLSDLDISPVLKAQLAEDPEAYVG